MKTTNRILSIILAVIMVVSMIPVSSMPVLAADADKAIILGTARLEGVQKDNIYFGAYKQSSNGSGGYNIDPIKWRVLSNGSGRLFLLSDQNLDVFKYHTEREGVTWETSTMRSWLNGLNSNKGNGNNAIDYASDNFLDTAFSGKEQNVIANTTVTNDDNVSADGGNNTTDKIFILSANEIYITDYFTDNNSRKATNTAYVAAGGRIASSGMDGVGTADHWWLRTPGHFQDRAASVYPDGTPTMTGDYVDYGNYAVRPAFNLDTSNVLFTSAAVGGKAVGTVGSMSAVNDYTGNEWKLTLLDSNRSFSVSNTIKTAEQGEEITLNYSGANTGPNEYVSAMILDEDGKVLYYGQIANNSASGTATLTVPTDLAPGSYTLKVFSEQLNGDKKTDYASAFDEVTLKVISYMDTAVIDGVTVPEIGNTLQSKDFEYTIPNGVKYVPGDGMWFESDVSIDTYNQFNGATEIKMDHEFKEGKYYTFLAMLHGLDAYRFEENMASVTVNGNDAKYNFMDTTENIEVWYTFYCKTPEVYDFTVAPKTLDFGTATEGYTDAPAAQTVTVTNTGNQQFALTAVIDSEDFVMVADEILVPEIGKSTTFTVQPKTGLAVGTHTAEVTIEAMDIDKKETVTVTFTVEEEKIYDFTVTPPTLDFGTVTEGYTDAPAAQTVTVTNTGNQQLALTAVIDSEKFVMVGNATMTLKAGESTTFTIQPKTGLAVGTHTAEVTVEAVEGTDKKETVTATFTVKAAPVPETVSPQTGDTGNMALMYALLFISGMGFVGTTVYGRKKRTN